MKLCFKCHHEKPLGEFYRHPMMGDGHLGKCIPCTKKDANTHRRTHVENARAYDRRRYRDDPARREQTRAQAQSWEERNPAGLRAKRVFSNAKKHGRVIPQPCIVCGRADAHGHHPDYSKPLDVMWLCPVHHAEQHQKEGRMRTGEIWAVTPKAKA